LILQQHQVPCTKRAYRGAQDEASSVVYSMPSKAVLAGGISKVLPLEDIASEVCLKIQNTQSLTRISMIQLGWYAQSLMNGMQP
jgi:hypothetical protein